MDISIGYSVKKPVETQEQCDKYAEMAGAVNEHNEGVAVGEKYWIIKESARAYTVAEGETREEDTEDESVSTDERLEAIEEAIAELAALQAGEV